MIHVTRAELQAVFDAGRHAVECRDSAVRPMSFAEVVAALPKRFAACCPWCSGRGTTPHLHRHGGDPEDPCPGCKPCPHCDGTGVQYGLDER